MIVNEVFEPLRIIINSLLGLLYVTALRLEQRLLSAVDMEVRGHTQAVLGHMMSPMDGWEKPNLRA